MTTPTDHDDFGALLRTALAARPAHVPPADLAARAMARARRASPAAVQLLRVRRLARHATTAAAILVTAVVLIAALRWPAPLASETAQSTTSEIGNSTSSANSRAELLLATAAVAGAFGLWRALGAGEPTVPDPRHALA